MVDGVPPRLKLAEADLQHWLDRRRPGTSRFTSQRKEPDAVKILSGVFEGVSTGAPIGLLIENVDQRSRDYSGIKETYRPGHADFEDRNADQEVCQPEHHRPSHKQLLAMSRQALSR